MKHAFGLVIETGNSVEIEAAIRKQYDLWIQAYNEPNEDLVGILAFSEATKVTQGLFDLLGGDSVDTTSKSNFITWFVFFNAAFRILFEKQVSGDSETPAGDRDSGVNLH